MNEEIASHRDIKMLHRGKYASCPTLNIILEWLFSAFTILSQH